MKDSFRSRRRAEQTRCAGTLISCMRIVAVVVRAWNLEARMPQPSPTRQTSSKTSRFLIS